MATCAWCGRYFEARGSDYYPFCGEKCRLESRGQDVSSRAAEAANEAAAAAREELAEVKREMRKQQREFEQRLKQEHEESERQREEERKRDPRRWYGHEWVENIVNHRADVAACDWWKLEGKDWARLLSRMPQFADKCDWIKLGGEDWATLLAREPRLADKCQWGKLESRDLRLILESQPQLVDKCPLKTLSSSSWARLLQVQPKLVDKCDKIGQFDGDHWAALLIRRPEFIERCADLSKLTVENLSSLLAKQPHLIEKFIKVLDVDDWAQLLLSLPRFSEDCDKWNEFSSRQLLDLLKTHPELSKHCKWSNMTEEDLVCLLSDTSEVDGDYKDWKQLTGDSWCKILIQNPSCLEKCDLKVLESRHWRQILVKHPELLQDCDVGKLDDDDVSYIVRKHPDLVHKIKGYSVKKSSAVFIDFLMLRWQRAMKVARDSKLDQLARVARVIGVLAESAFRVGIVGGFTFGLCAYFGTIGTAVPSLDRLIMLGLLCVAAECSLFKCRTKKRFNIIFVSFVVLMFVGLGKAGVPASDSKAAGTIMLGIIPMWMMATFLIRRKMILGLAGSALAYLAVGCGIGWLGSPYAYASAFNSDVGIVLRLLLTGLIGWLFYRNEAWKSSSSSLDIRWGMTFKCGLLIGALCCVRVLLMKWDLLGLYVRIAG